MSKTVETEPSADPSTFQYSPTSFQRAARFWVQSDRNACTEHYVKLFGMYDPEALQLYRSAVAAHHALAEHFREKFEQGKYRQLKEGKHAP